MNIDVENDSPTVRAFLALLEIDIERNSGNLKPVDAAALARARELTAGVTYSEEDFL